ncbi:MAG: cbb3-type cytochrome c oxidase subunit I [Verrucomicrobiota bacterium]
MINAPTNAASAEVTPIDTQARTPLLLLVGSGLVWLLVSGLFALITSIQLHAPHFLANCEPLTHGRAQAIRETSFVYGWCANAGLAISLWVLGRLGGNLLRAPNWTIVGTLFWNLGLTVGLVGIAIGDMTSIPLLQLPSYVQPLMVVAYGAIALSGVLAWSGRRNDGTFASQWYAAAALFLLPWLFIAAQAVLIWMPVRGVAQAIAAGWFAQGLIAMWLAPLALAGAYYVVPKTAGRILPSYDFAPLAFWVLIFIGAWTGGRHLIGGPVPAWVATIAVVATSLVLFHYLVVFLNLRIATASTGEGAKFIRFGLLAYLVFGVLEFLMSFRGIALETQFTLLATAHEQLGLYGAFSMMFYGVIYYMVPRLTGQPWASAGLVAGHRVFAMVGVLLLVVTLGVAGCAQGAGLLDPANTYATILGSMNKWLLGTTVANLLLLGANFLLFVNFAKTACSACCSKSARSENLFRQPSTLEASAT